MVPGTFVRAATDVQTGKGAWHRFAGQELSGGSFFLEGPDGRVMSESFDRLLARTERRVTAFAGRCPDPGVLAAYLDSGLAPSERRDLEAHAADCARCALQLATMVRLEDESGHPQHAPTLRWRRFVWLVPAATVVIVAAIYVALPGRSPSPAETTSHSAAARTQEAQSADRVLDTPQRQAPEPSASRHDAVSARERAQESPASAPAQAPPLVRPSEELKEAATRQAPPSEHQAGTAAKTESRAEAAAMSAPASPPADVAAPALERARIGANAADAFVRTPLIVRAPGGRVLWRVAGSQIDRSTDAGRTWLPESAPPAAAIMTGAAPSDDECWLATPTGQVLRRNEAGTWRDVTPSPPPAIARIMAPGPAVATIIAIDGTTIRTTDGGQHWTPGPPR